MRRLKTGRRPPIYPKTPGHLPCSSLTHPLPLSSRRPSVSFGGFGLSTKIHRAYVTHTNADYIGSIAIDRTLMEKIDLWEYEKVLVCDVTNGNRWETYVLPDQ